MSSVAPVAVLATVFAVPETAVVPTSPRVDDDTGESRETRKVAFASTPFGMGFVLRPQAMHLICPVPLAQESDFPAAARAEPAVNVIPLKTPEE